MLRQEQHTRHISVNHQRGYSWSTWSPKKYHAVVDTIRTVWYSEKPVNGEIIQEKKVTSSWKFPHLYPHEKPKHAFSFDTIFPIHRRWSAAIQQVEGFHRSPADCAIETFITNRTTSPCSNAGPAISRDLFSQTCKARTWPRCEENARLMRSFLSHLTPSLPVINDIPSPSNSCSVRRKIKYQFQLEILL